MGTDSRTCATNLDGPYKGAHSVPLPEIPRRITIWKAALAAILSFACVCVFLPTGVRAQTLQNIQHAVSQSSPAIIIMKSAQTLELRDNEGKIRKFRVCLGINPVGPKKITGDQKTPEGDYFICFKSTESSFYRFLGISYPGAADAQSAFEQGLISLNDRDSIINSAKSGKAPPWNTKLGGWVGIHGYPTEWFKRVWVILHYPKPHNWTDGCIAMWNFEVEELFSRVGIGTPVRILP